MGLKRTKLIIIYTGEFFFPFSKTFSCRELRDIGGYFGVSVWNDSANSLGMDLA